MAEDKVERITAPTITLPKGGGAIKGIGESFTTDAITGTASVSVPIAVSPGRSGFGPSPALRYDSGTGNGPFGAGWRLDMPMISRRTDAGVPEYTDDDVFVLSGADHLVPAEVPVREVDGHRVHTFRPRVESGFARIERWTSLATGDVWWRVIDRHNVTSVFGADPDSRISDGSRVFRWLISESWDDRGNWITYGYKRENADGVDLGRVSEARRSRRANLYPKWIRYGNRVSRRVSQNKADAGWLFQVVFDYGEHDAQKPAPDDPGVWPCRQDSFSDYRAGFEVRTHRLCRRVLMFHRFGPQWDVVRSTEVSYADSPVLTQPVAVTVRGWRRTDSGDYATEALPAVEFDYSPVGFTGEVKTTDVGPEGIDGDRYALVDLDGEGIAGVLARQAEGWFWRRGEGGGAFGQSREIAAPTGPGALMDLTGEGRLALVDLGGERPGFTPRHDDEWHGFTAFAGLPTVDWEDADLRLVDLTGDGRTDVLITDGDALVWYPSDGAKGFGPARRVSLPRHDDDGPVLILADADRAVYLADMSGDGLADLVRVRSGEICYWPSLGHGRFGPKVVMDRAPVFPDPFDAGRILLVDSDGSGTIDLVHCGQSGARLWANQSGNGWGQPTLIPGFPAWDTLSLVQAGDLTGTGTGCLMWSAPGQRFRYVELAGGVKPHLLVGLRNNMGARTVIGYATSTQFYLDDRAAGRPWRTRLPFPVHVVERVETVDALTGNNLVSRYRYRHGYFDGVEREFRGFGLVERVDTEAMGGLPPTLTRTWFDTGAPRDLAFAPSLLPPPTVPLGLTAQEERDAWRALRGTPVREEIYAQDGSVLAEMPYRVVENTVAVRRLQARVFLTQPREGLDCLHERTSDPRIAHGMTLEVDNWGNPVRSVSIAYGRAKPSADPRLAPQGATRATLTESSYTNAVSLPDAHRAPLPAQTRVYELVQLKPSGSQFTFSEVLAQVNAANDLPYEDFDHLQVVGPGPHRRLIHQTGTRYRADDLSGLLAPGVLESLALPGESLTMALTPGLRAAVYTQPVTAADGGYSEVDGHWYVPSGRSWLHPDGQVPGEADFARDHFFQPHRFTDAFGAATVLTYDGASLLVVESKDAVGNVIKSEHDYRLLQPWRQTDSNGNRTELAFDELGLVVATAVRGKENQPVGDSLTGLADPGLTTFLADPQTHAAAVLGNATTRFVPDLHAYAREGSPSGVATLARDRHAADPGPTQIRITFSYLDGFGRELQSKVQSERPQTPWVGSGTSVYNNKGLPVLRYEPFFSATHKYEPGQVHGVSTARCHDPLGREVATVHPDHSYAKVLFDPWQQATWDGNDTVALDPRTDPDVASHTAWYLSGWNGWQTWRQEHLTQPEPVGAGTPAMSYVDSLGRTFLTVADNGAAGTIDMVSTLDIQGRVRKVVDARAVTVSRIVHDMLGRELHTVSPDAGERWVLPDVTGAPVKVWDGRGFARTMSYDALRRPVEVTVDGRIVQRVIYGEAKGDAQNHRGRVFQTYDGAGLTTNVSYDFKGNLTRFTRRCYASPSADSVLAQLDTEYFTGSTEFDAFDRPVWQVAPHSNAPLTKMSVVRLGWNRAQLLTRVDAWLDQSVEPTVAPAPETATHPVVAEIEYNERGQRTRIVYRNGTESHHEYDPRTFRLTRLTTLRGADKLQDLSYRYDPAGNVVSIVDGANDTVFHNQQAVTPGGEFRYDAVYRLVAARGREHRDSPYLALLPNDGQALRQYVETYEYDKVGNLTRMRHHGGGDVDNPGAVLWNRAYTYAPDSNRLLDAAGDPFTHDKHGNVTAMPGLAGLEWNESDRLNRVDLGGGGEVRYTYDGGGQRVRKVWNKAPGLTEERIYLGGFEIFRRRDGFGEVTLARETLHLMDGSSRVALIETRTYGSDEAPQRVMRFQLANQLGSALVELDASAQVISYEEFHPYGSTAYEACRSLTETPKRYRYTGKERDQETGLAYHGARYYSPALGRWTAADPAGLVDGPNRYAYAGGNPIRLNDPSGTQSAPKNDFGGNLPPGGLPPPDTTSYLPPPKEDPPVDPKPDPPKQDPPPPPKPAAKKAAPQKKPDEIGPDPKTQADRDFDAFIHLNYPPDKYALDHPDWGMLYYGAYFLKHTVQDLYEAVDPPDTYYLDSEQHVQKSTIRPDTSDKGAVALGNLTMMFLPMPKEPVPVNPILNTESRFTITVQNGKPIIRLPELNVQMQTESSYVRDGVLNTLEDVGGKTTGTTHAGPNYISGWGYRSQIGEYNPAVSNWHYSMGEGGTPFPTHPFDYAGAPGSYYASHVEAQILYTEAGVDFMEVSRNPCVSCRTRLSMTAVERDQTIIVLAPRGFMWFSPFGTFW